MKLADKFNEVIEEIKLANADPKPWLEEGGLPDFVGTESGITVFFNKSTKNALWDLSSLIFQNRPESAVKIDKNKFYLLARTCIAEMYSSHVAEGKSFGIKPYRDLKAAIEKRISARPFTHYYPATCMAIDRLSPLVVGPVTIFSTRDWIDQVKFSEFAIDKYNDSPEANRKWKEILLNAISSNSEVTELEGLANSLYLAVKDTPAVVKVTVDGYEQDYSRRFGKIAAKTTLDALSLGLASRNSFFQQTLQDEHLPPYRIHSIIETEGNLWLPGSTFSDRFCTHSESQIIEVINRMNDLFGPFGNILQGVIDPRSHRHKKLTNRWATALDWFAEGMREDNDAIAVAKIGTSLDVLSNGGKCAGILQMISKLTGTSADFQSVKGIRPRTLEELISDIYEYGRSQILHGNHYDRMMSFDSLRTHSTFIARAVLLEAVILLHNYEGPDLDSFRNLPPPE